MLQSLPELARSEMSYIACLIILCPRARMQDEISSAANPSLQLLEQHGLGGLIPSGRNAAAPPPHPPLAAGKGAKEPSPRTNPVINRREST